MRLRSTATYDPERGSKGGAAPAHLRWSGKLFGTLDQERPAFPFAPQPDFPLLKEGDPAVDPHVVAAFGTEDDYVAKVRAIRSRILSSLDTRDDLQGRKIAAITIGAGDEAAILSANLAVVFAQLGTTTLLIDAGLNRPRIDRLFRLSNNFGLTDHLQGARNQRAVQKSAIGRLWVMTTGPAIAGGSGLIEKGSLVDLIDKSGAPSRLTLVHFPSITGDSSPPGSLIAGFDGALLVARRDHTAIEDMRRAIDDLDANKVPIFGSVVA
jgi:protein-tyrosine kinase